MRTRGRRATLAVALAILAAAVTIDTARDAARPAHAAGSSAKNIVVIDVDDMRTDELQYLTKTLALLPGTVFPQSFVSTSLCCPSRAALLSGQYTQNDHVKNNSGYRKFNHTDTIASWLHDAGYFTSIIGKYLNGYTCNGARPPGWDHWQALCSKIYNMYGYTIMDRATRVQYGKTPAEYQTDVVAQRSVDTIDEATASGQPFFMWITPTAPHSGPGPRVAERYKDALANWQLPIGSNFNEADVSDKPAYVRRLRPIRIIKGIAKTITVSERNRLRMELAIDDLVERVVNELTVTGQLDNTVIMFTSDNGFMHGEHRIQSGKAVEFQESLSVPLLISGPGIPVGTSDSIVMNTDLAPTIADLAGVTPGRIVDGRSLVPLFDGAPAWTGRAIRHHVTQDDNEGGGGSVAHPQADGVRAGPYSYFELATGERELYDHISDPFEMTNVAGEPRYRSLQAHLAAMLLALETCNGADCQLDLGNIPPTADAIASCANRVCDFDATASDDLDGSIASYDWDFGDGYTGSGATPTHGYSVAGDYEVTLTVTDDQGATDVRTLEVTGTSINVAPTAAFTAQCVDFACAFDAFDSVDSDGTIASYAWDFGDGTTGSGIAPPHQYLAGGLYTVRLTVTDNLGATDTTTQTVAAIAPDMPPIPFFTKSCSGLDCDFNAVLSSDPDGTIASYDWDFGDGTTASGVTAQHSYESSGVYGVTLVVTDDLGLSDLVVVQVTV